MHNPTTATTTTRLATPGLIGGPGNPVDLTVTLPPSQADSNKQFVAQFSKVLKTVTTGAVGATPHSLAVTVAQVSGNPNQVDIHVHVPPSIAQDPEACTKLHEAVFNYLAGISSDVTVSKVSSGDSRTPNALRLDLSGLPAWDFNAKSKVDQAIARLNTAASLLHHLGCDAKRLIDLLGDNFSVQLLCLPFEGKPPVVQLHAQKDQIGVVVNGQGFPTNDANDIAVCASVLSKKLGLKSFTIELLAEATQSMGSPHLCTQYLRAVVEGDHLADKTAASKAVDVLTSVLGDPRMRTPIGNEGPFKFCGAVLVQLSSQETSHHLELAWKLLHHMYPQGLENLKDGGCAKVLDKLFESAMLQGKHLIAEGAINALGTMKGPSADEAYERCFLLLQEHETYQVFDRDDPQRQKLRDAEFEFKFTESADHILQPAAKKEGQPPTKFDPAKHGQALVDYALSLKEAATMSDIVASCLASVVEFLLDNLSALPRSVQVDVRAKLVGDVVGVIRGVYQSVDEPGPVGAPAVVRRLPRSMEVQTLTFALTRIRKLVDEGNNDSGKNLMCWLLQHKNSLFGTLPPKVFDAVVSSMLPDKTAKTLTANFASVKVDEAKARAEMGPHCAQLFEMIAVLVESGSLSHAPDVAQTLFGYWKTFTGSDDLGYQMAIVQHLASKPQTDSPEDWSIATKVAEGALQALLKSLRSGAGASQVVVAASQVAVDLYASLIDLVVGAATARRNGDLAGEVFLASTIEFLEDLGANQELLASMSQVNPNAATWAQLSCAQLLLGKNKLGTAYDIIVACVSRPGVTWDKRFAAAFEAAIKHCVGLGSEQLREPAVQLFMIRNRCIKWSAAPVPPLPLATLQALAQIVQNALANETNPDVSREDALLAVLMELLTHQSAIAEGQLEHVLSTQLLRQHHHTHLRGEQLEVTRTVTSNHPALASRAYLEFAKHYFAQGDQQAMLTALSKAMANVPDDEDARDEVQVLFAEFFEVVKSRKESAADWHDTLQKMSAFHRV